MSKTGKCQVEKAAEVRNKEPGEIVPANRVVEGRRLRHTGRMNWRPPPTEILGASSTAQRTSHIHSSTFGFIIAVASRTDSLLRHIRLKVLTSV